MIRKLALAFVLILQTACTAGTLEPTATPTQTFTSTPLPTPTVVPTSTPFPAPKPVRVEADGFSLLIPPLMDFDLQGNTVGIFNKEGTLIVSFSRAPYDDSVYTLQKVIDEYLAELASRGGEFEQGEAFPITVAGAEGIAVDLTGILFGVSVEGRAFAVNPAKDSLFFGLGFSNIETDADAWMHSGAEAFETLTDSVEFINVQSSGTCVVSADPTYGYTEENPIRVGGDFLEGPARERAYLNNLLGPNGEILSYFREGSFPSGDTILDAYRITGPGVEEVLYLDEYKYEPLEAPVGFTCVGEFPLSAP
jgi:hypothetical protein